MLDPECPNIELYMLGSREDCYLISAADLVKKIKAQLDQDLDHNYTPISPCRSSGAPFKITCAAFRYTVVGKGTTSRLWGEVSREADVYRVLKHAQGSGCSCLSRVNQFGLNILPPRPGQDPLYASHRLGW